MDADIARACCSHARPISPNIPRVCEGSGLPVLVSVLIPTYNRAYILKTVLESVFAQTYRPIEVVVVDDGSTDDTRAVVEKFGSEISYIYQKNAGLASARNAGLAVARGEFIAFEDSDDIWFPWKLQVQVAFLKRFPEVALTWTDMTAVDEHGTVIGQTFLRKYFSAYSRLGVDEIFPKNVTVKEVCPDSPPEISGVPIRYGDIFSGMFIGNLVHPPTALMRREYVHRAGGLDVSFTRAGEDYEFFLRISRQGLGAVVDTPGMLYRIGAKDQNTHPTRSYGKAHAFLRIMKRCLAEDRSKIRLSELVIHRSLAEAYAWVAEQEFMADELRVAASYFLKSLRLNFFNKRALVLLPFCFIPRPLFRICRSMKRRIRPSFGTAK